MVYCVYMVEKMGTAGDRLLRTLFIYIWALALVHLVAQHLFLYWHYKWLDIPMHFLGGVWVGLAALWLWYYSGYGRKGDVAPHRPWIVALAGGFAFGVLWECYDFLVWNFGAGAFPVNYLQDTALDIVMDLIGAFTAFLLFTFMYRRAQREG